LRSQKVKADADRYALAVLPIIIEIHANGETSLGEIAAELNNRAIPTARGRQWQPMTVSNLLARVRRLLLDATFLEHDRADTAVCSRSQDFL